MRKLLIVKTGSTYSSLRAIKGDFDAWVVRGLGRESGVETEVADVAAGAPLPGARGYAGVIVTGSPAMVTERLGWSERTALWLREAVREEVPTLGICFGHQLLAYALGGSVGDNPRGLECGTVVVTPNAFGTQDALLGEFQGPFKAYMSHRQSVLALPKGAVPLASTRLEPNAAFAFERCAWGVQFHPEFDSRIMRVYVLRNKDRLAAQGADIKELFDGCLETGCGRTVFAQFLKVVARGGARGGLARAV